VSTQAVVAPAAPPPTGEPVTLRARAGSFAIDCALLGAALLWAAFVGLTVGTSGELGWLALVWLVVVAPLYFALYHAYGTGATPGQRELGIAVRGAADARLSLRASLLRTYLAPLLFASAVRDRVTVSRVVRIDAPAAAPSTLLPTAAGLTEIFEPVTAGRALRRARRLVWSHRRELVRSVLAVYLGLVALAAVIAPLFIDDFSGASDAGSGQALIWTLVAIALFASGVYWKQAAVSAAVEAIRTGEPIGVREVLRRSARHVNGLTAALVLLVLLSALVELLPLGFVLLPYAVARCIFVIPAIVIEDLHVLAAFRRSIRLTRAHDWRRAGTLIVSAILTMIVLGLAGSICVGIVSAVWSPSNSIGYAYVVAAGLALASVPVSFALAVIGTTWTLYYYDLRRAESAG